MLVATREDRVRHDMPHAGPAEPPRPLVSRFSSSLQLLGSIVGIPLALIGGYSTYHTTFSTEAKCQSLRSGIVSMLDKKADATTLRLLVQRDVAAFQKDCGEVDPDAVAAFKNLMAPAQVARAAHPKIEATKVEAPKAEAPKVEAAAKVESVKAAEPAKAEAPKKPQPAPVVVKAEKPVQEAKPQVVESKPQVVEAKPQAIPEPKPVEVAVVKPAAVTPEPKVEAAPQRSEAEHADSAWIASVREALRESAARPVTSEPTDVATPMPPPIVVSAPPLRRELPPWVDADAPRPPADVPMAPPQRIEAPPPVPPADIPAQKPPEN